VHVRGRDLRSELARLRTWPLAIFLVLLGWPAWVYKLALGARLVPLSAVQSDSASASGSASGGRARRVSSISST
jgi:hypothetical protein